MGLEFFHKYKSKGKYTQFGEQGIIDEIIRRIKPKKKTAIEFGAPTWEFCSNTAHLAEHRWDVRMFDIDPKDPRITKREITPDNVNELKEPTLLSIDCDGPDFWLWFAYGWHPDIVIIEIDSSVGPSTWQLPMNGKGASYLPMVTLGEMKGYFLICHTGNLIWVLSKYRDLFPEVTGDPVADSNLYFNTDHL